MSDDIDRSRLIAESDKFVAEQPGNEISIVQRGARLKIVADVDPEGIKTLHEMLADHLRRAEQMKPKRRHRRTKAA